MSPAHKPWETVLLVVITLIGLALIACFGAAGVIAVVGGVFAFSMVGVFMWGFDLLVKKWEGRKRG